MAFGSQGAGYYRAGRKRLLEVLSIYDYVKLVISHPEYLFTEQTLTCDISQQSSQLK